MQLDPKITTVIWDLDGTLLDSFGVYASVLSSVLCKREWLIPSEETMRLNFHGSLRDSINAALGGVSEVMLDEIVDDFLIIQNDYYGDIDRHFYRDAVRFAKGCHENGLRQILVTNRSHEGRLRASPRYIIENSTLKYAITEIVCGDDSEHHKPDPQVLGDFDIDPRQTVVIGDQFVDAEFACNLGCMSIIVARQQGTDPLERATPLARSDANVVTQL